MSINTKELTVLLFHPPIIFIINKIKTNSTAKHQIIKYRTIWSYSSSHHQKLGHLIGIETSKVRSEQSIAMSQIKIMVTRFWMEINKISRELTTLFSISGEIKGP